jgi:hypothetical protein
MLNSSIGIFKSFQYTITRQKFQELLQEAHFLIWMQQNLLPEDTSNCNLMGKFVLITVLQTFHQELSVLDDFYILSRLYCHIWGNIEIMPSKLDSV